MIPKLKISAFLVKRLERVKHQCSGCLFGIFYGEGVLVLMGFNLESTIGQLNYDQVQYKFPAELDLCGLVKFGDCTDAEAHLTEVFKDVDITDNPILLNCELGTRVDMNASVFMHGKLQEMPFEIIDGEQLYNDFCFTRLRVNLEVFANDTPESVCQEMNALRKLLSGGSLAFNVESTRIFITCMGTTGTATIGGGAAGNNKRITNTSQIKELINAVADVISMTGGDSREENIGSWGIGSGNGKKKKGGDKSHSNNNNDSKFLHRRLNHVFGALGCDYDILNIDVLQCKTRHYQLENNAAGDASSRRGSTIFGSSIDNAAMTLTIRRDEPKICIPLELEAMAMLSKDTYLSRLYDILIESICRSLRLFEYSIKERLNEAGNIVPERLAPRTHHFYPQELGHFLSCSYLDDIPDDDSKMQDKRKRLHRHFDLPVTRPYFRRSNRCIFLCDINDFKPLMNTHIGVRPSGIVDGKQYLVQGNYYYYHYLQDGIQDKGWGCAYRSLQTICSWFLLQGYSDQPVPTHKQIQQYLIRIGDKNSSFNGSTQWIGSTEVSMCLHGFTNVDSRILHVTSGAELATIASDLAMHFQTQGTPVMIGGGVLAHTIIGIDYCIQTGQVKFLILDPHFTGADDLQIIQSKGWCGWKGVEFWDRKSYYNLCMPQRPIIF